MYHLNPLAFGNAQENVNIKFFLRESMASLAVRTDTGLNVAYFVAFLGY